MYFSILSTKLSLFTWQIKIYLITRYQLLCYLPLVWILTRVGQGEEACFKDGLWLVNDGLLSVNDGEFSWFSAKTVSNNCTTFSGNFIWNGNWIVKISSQIVTVGFKSDSKASLLVCQSHPSLAVFSCFFEKQVQVYLEPLTLCRMWKTSNMGGRREGLAGVWVRGKMVCIETAPPDRSKLAPRNLMWSKNTRVGRGSLIVEIRCCLKKRHGKHTGISSAEY